MEITRSEQELVRREKLEKIKEYCNPYPEKYEVTNSIKEARELVDGTENVKIAGRIIFMRKMGKLKKVVIITNILLTFLNRMVLHIQVITMVTVVTG